MTSVWKRLQRVGKRAAKFQFVACYHELVLECTKKWQPDKLVVVWTRRNRRICSKAHSWQPGIQNPYRGTVVWMVPENVDISVTLYRDPHVDQYETKEWTFIIENESKGQRKVLATVDVNLAHHAGPVPAQVPLRLRLKPKSVKVVHAELSLTLSGVLLREGRATDDDMQSLASLMSVKPSDVGNLDDFAESDEEEANGPGAPEVRTRGPQSDLSRELKTLCEEEDEGHIRPQQAAARPSSAEDTSPAPVSAPAPPVRAFRGQGSEPAAITGGQVGPETPEPPPSPPETRSTGQPGQTMVPTPAPRLRKGSDAPSSPVPCSGDEVPNTSEDPPTGMGSSGETQAQISSQEGTEAHEARPEPDIEVRGSKDSLGGERSKVEEEDTGDRPGASGAGNREKNTKKSDTTAGEAGESSELHQVDAEQKSKVQHRATEGPEAAGLTPKARLGDTPEAPPRSAQRRMGVRTQEEAPSDLNPPPAEPEEHLGDLRDARPAGQEKGSAEVRGKVPAIGRAGPEQGSSARAASAGPQVSCVQTVPSDGQGVKSRDQRAQEAEVGESRVLETEAEWVPWEVIGTSKTDAGIPESLDTEAGTAESEILEAQESEAARSEGLEPEAAGTAESEVLRTQNNEIVVLGMPRTGPEIREPEEFGETEVGGFTVPDTKTVIAETEILETQGVVDGEAAVLKTQAEISETQKTEAGEAEAGTLESQKVAAEGLGAPEVGAEMAEAEKLGVQETEVEIWRIPRIETETAGTETLGIHKIGPPQMQPRLVGDQETDVSVMETAEDAILGTREITAGCGVLLIEAKIPESKIDRSLETEEGDLGVLEVDTGIAEAKILGIPERAPGVQKALGAGTEVARVLEAEAASSEVPETDAEEAETLQAKERSESSVALRVVANLPESELLGTQKTEVGGTGISQREVREAETEIPKTQEISSEGSGVPDLEAKMEESGRKMEIWETPEVEKVNSELFGTQKGSEIPELETKTIKSEILDAQETEVRDLGLRRGEAEKAEAEMLETQKMEAKTARDEEIELVDPGVSSPEAEALRVQWAGTVVLESGEVKADILGVQKPGSWGALKYEALDVPVTKQRLSGAKEVVPEVPRAQEPETKVLGIVEAKSWTLGQQEAEMEGFESPENKSNIFEAQEADSGVLGTMKGKEAVESLEEAGLSKAQVASEAGAGVPRPSGASSLEEPEEDRRLPGSQVGLGATVCQSASPTNLGLIEQWLCMDPPGGLRCGIFGRWGGGVSVSRRSIIPPPPGCPGPRTQLGCMELHPLS